ncbi:MAG: hypothetical protein AB8B47_12135 [Roseobacter sp.]
MIRALALSVCFASPLVAQTPQSFIVDVWTDFSQTCTPFFSDPIATAAQLPRTGTHLDRSETPNAQIVHLYDGYTLNRSGREMTVEFVRGQSAFLIHCEVGRSENAVPFPPEVLDMALRDLVANSGGLNLIGGAMQQISTSGDYSIGAGDYFNWYAIEGALGNRIEFIEVEIAEQLVTMYVSATLPLEAKQ